MTAADVVEVLVAVSLATYAIVEAMVVWAQRPPVVYNSWTGRWGAQRAMEDRHGPVLRPAVYPPTPRLKVVDDLAS